MSDSELSKGLNCPRCGGVILVPDGQVIVRCPSCDFRSIVRGDLGVRRQQVLVRVTREQAKATLQKFLNNFAIAFDAPLSLLCGMSPRLAAKAAPAAFCCAWDLAGKTISYRFEMSEM